MVPTKWNGSAKIYHSVIKPFVLKHQKKVDAALDKMADTAQNVIDEGNLSKFLEYFDIADVLCLFSLRMEYCNFSGFNLANYSCISMSIFLLFRL